MKREIYSLKVFSTRMEFDSFRLELTPQENIEENDYFGMYFTMTVNCRGEQCAKLWGKLFDENRVYRSGMDILNVADPVDREEVRMAEVFNGCMELREREKKWETLQGFSGYLNGVFVQPAFRGRGIAGYLLRHLHRILLHAMNIRVRAVAVSPKPFLTLDGDIVEDAALLAQNRLILEKCGYHEIQDLSLSSMSLGFYDDDEDTGTGYYVRVYPVV